MLFRLPNRDRHIHGGNWSKCFASSHIKNRHYAQVQYQLIRHLCGSRRISFLVSKMPKQDRRLPDVAARENDLMSWQPTQNRLHHLKGAGDQKEIVISRRFNERNDPLHADLPFGKQPKTSTV
jgi:hypothetical protein